MTEASSDIDLRPRIHYSLNGRANKIVEPWLDNSIPIESGYVLTPDGKYIQLEGDVEGTLQGWPREWEIPKEELVELAENNPGYLPAHKVLGVNQETVRNIAKETGVEVVHIPHPKMN